MKRCNDDEIKLLTKKSTLEHTYASLTFQQLSSLLLVLMQNTHISSPSLIAVPVNVCIGCVHSEEELFYLFSVQVSVFSHVNHYVRVKK